jgi:hypothetical protein
VDGLKSAAWADWAYSRVTDSRVAAWVDGADSRLARVPVVCWCREC